MRGFVFVVLCLLLQPRPTFAEVTGVTIASRSVIAGGRSFRPTGPYKSILVGVAFALNPVDPHNRRIVDLEHARRDADGRVRFSSDLSVLRPTDPSKGNGVLLFQVANRGRVPSPNSEVVVGSIVDLLMREGYTLVRVGWEIDLPAPLLRIDAPAALLPAGSDDRLSVEIMLNERVSEAFLVDDPAGRPPVIYPPAESQSPSDVLTVRDRFWDEGTVIPRDRWRFIVGPGNLPKLQLDPAF